jgi:hypothetical protein
VTRRELLNEPVDLSELAAEAISELRGGEGSRAVATEIEPQAYTAARWLGTVGGPAPLLGGACVMAADSHGRRVILFTEYADTKRYLVELLTAALSYTDNAEQRIRQFHGGMGDDARDEVQRAFNAAPEIDPVRILIATDAAREGVNLQAHCADIELRPDPPDVRLLGRKPRGRAAGADDERFQAAERGGDRVRQRTGRQPRRDQT